VGEGCLPLIDLDGREGNVYSWSEPVWDIRSFRSSRVFLNANIDEPLTILVDELPKRLQSLNIEDSTNDTLILVLRSVTPWDNFIGILDSAGGQVVDRHSVLIIGGLSYVENLQAGIDLNGRDPAYFIEHTCLALAGKEHDHDSIQIYLDDIEAKKKADKKKEDKVKRRARKILVSLLNETQRAEFKKKKSFHVLGKDGFTYLITNRLIHNVFRIEDGRRTFEYCVITSGFVPLYDQMLSQKLLLESNPQMFLDISNMWLLMEDGQRIPQIKDSPLNPEATEADRSLWIMNGQ
jgi:hypothetical protein